jgi:hypothetical protein
LNLRLKRWSNTSFNSQKVPLTNTTNNTPIFDHESQRKAEKEALSRLNGTKKGRERGSESIKRYNRVTTNNKEEDMTKEEAIKQLEEINGCKVKIVEGGE